MVEDIGGDHQFVGAGGFGKCDEAVTHIVDGADGKLLAVPRDTVAIDRRIRIGGSVLRRLKRWMLALGPEHKIKVGAGGNALSFSPVSAAIAAVARIA